MAGEVSIIWPGIQAIICSLKSDQTTNQTVREPIIPLSGQSQRKRCLVAAAILQSALPSRNTYSMETNLRPLLQLDEVFNMSRKTTQTPGYLKTQEHALFIPSLLRRLMTKNALYQPSQHSQFCHLLRQLVKTRRISHPSPVSFAAGQHMFASSA